MTARVFMAPGAYVQGPGALDLVGEKAASFGVRASVVCDAAMLGPLEERLSAALGGAGVMATFHAFSGEVTRAAIAALAGAAAEAPHVVVGVGGGRAIDAGKGAALTLDRPFISVPTVASTDAPASRGIAIYDESHRVVAVEQLPRNPEWVLVDTEVIAAAPARFLRAGLGDALSKKFETEGVFAGSGLNKHGTRPLHAARAMAQACYDAVRAHGVAALAACEAGQADESLEAAVEAILLLSPMAFENSGLSVAHAMAPVLAAMPAAGGSLHGEHAAYGTLVQVLAEGRPRAETDELIGFCREIGLPTSLSGLGLGGIAEGEIRGMAEACAAGPHMENQARRLSARDIEAAMLALEEMG